MKLCFRILAIAVIAVSTYTIIGCAAPASFSYQNISASISAQCGDCENGGNVDIFNPAFPAPPLPGNVVYMPPGGGQGGDIVLTVSVNNAPATGITWAIYPQPNLGSISSPPTGTAYPVGESCSDVGLFLSTSGATAVYGAPGTNSLGSSSGGSGCARPPNYTGASLVQAQALNIPQGDVLIVASIPADPSNPNKVVTVSQMVQVLTGGSTPTPRLYPFTPLVPAGITAPAVTIARNATYPFYGYVTGALPCTSTVTCAAAGTPLLYTANNNSLWEVCTQPFTITSCVVGGNTTLGTITQTGLYTAPATIPSPQPVVLNTSQSNPTIANTNNYANVAIN
jgi:hypothetical protein